MAVFLALPPTVSLRPSNLALPGPSPLSQSHPSPPSQPYPANDTSATSNSPMSAAVAGLSTPPTHAMPTTPAPLTLEQQHIMAVEVLFPHYKLLATVNLDCRLDLKTIALHTRDAAQGWYCFLAYICHCTLMCFVR